VNVDKPKREIWLECIHISKHIEGKICSSVLTNMHGHICCYILARHCMVLVEDMVEDVHDTIAHDNQLNEYCSRITVYS
jgi:hypothetical protein